MKKQLLLCTLIFACVSVAKADERLYGYSYEASVLPEGAYEIEQSITNQNGKEDGDFSEWDFRTELEYGVSDRYMTAFYLNWKSVRSDGAPDQEDEDGASFEGVSWENIYQILNPNLDPVGLAVYSELTSDGLDYELEGKILLSKPITENLSVVANAIYEAEWEREDRQTEEEGSLAFTFGGSYKVSPSWSIGLEARNTADYPGGINLTGREFQAWSVGPNIHYGNPKWWATLTVLPQVWGDGDGAESGRNLVHEESVEVRLIAGIVF